MAKRFTDTEKYDKAWFRRLPCRMKVAWDWLCCNCDKIGVWNVDMEKLSFEVGEPVTLLELTETFKVRVFDENKLFIPSFVPFQYGDASGKLSFKAGIHRDIAKQLELRGFPVPEFRDSPEEEEVKNNSDTSKAPPTPLPGDLGLSRGRGRRRSSNIKYPLSEIWNETAHECLPRVAKLSPNGTRSKSANARWEEHPDPEFWRGVIKKINSIPGLLGLNDRKWKANFEWLVRPDTAAMVLEGKYDQWGQSEKSKHKPSALLRAEMGETG